MLIRFNTYSALVASAAFAYSSLGFAQAPIVDASVEPYVNQAAANNQLATNVDSASLSSNTQGELFTQFQLLQQEVMQLRGIVEEQAHLLKRMKEQNMERYIDLDRRLGELAKTPVHTAPVNVANNKPTIPKVAAQVGEKSRYDVAYNLVISKRFDEALNSFKLFLVDFPSGKYVPNSLYWLGELYQVVTPQDLEASRQAFAQLLDQYPAHAKASDAMYKLGKVYFQKGNKEKSRQWMERVVADYGNGVNAAADKARQFLSTKF